MDERLKNSGKDMYELIVKLYPICRSITGDGVRKTLKKIKELIPIKEFKVPSGTRVFDWEVPEEWNIKDAYIKDLKGNRVVDFKESNLHVMGYSVPVKERIPLHKLKRHLFTLPHQPDAIPYRTSYYKRNWGFCISQNQMNSLMDPEYDVCIDSSFKKGHLIYAELLVKGRSDEEVLISTHICHPSLCNDNLSGIAVVTYLAKLLMGITTRYSYRFLFIPGTIGSITWLAENESNLHRIKHGLVISCVGDGGDFTYKRSRRGSATIDKAVEKALEDSGMRYRIRNFTPFGYDERQFCSPGFNLPVGCFMRSPCGEFVEYHTSLDNLTFVRPRYLKESLYICFKVLNILEENLRYVSTNQKCEPQLGKRGLYKEIGGGIDRKNMEKALLWVLNLADGKKDVLEMSIEADMSFWDIQKACEILKKHSLLKTI